MILYLNLLFYVVCFSIVMIITLVTIEKIRLFKITTNFEKYALVLEYYKKKAYDMIYKDRVLIYSLEGVHISDKEFNVISKDFALLVFKLIGPNLKDEFIALYGDEETLIFNLMEYFNSTIDDDEIRKKAEDNLLNNEDDNLLLK